MSGCRGPDGHPVGGGYRAPESDEAEKAAIRRALEEADGVRAEAARLLGMSRTTLWRRMQEYDLD